MKMKSKGYAADELLKAIGKRIRLKRACEGMTQHDLGQAVGIHPVYMGSVEKGRSSLTCVNLFRICQALDVDPTQLMKNLFEKYIDDGKPHDQKEESGMCERCGQPYLQGTQDTPQ